MPPIARQYLELTKPRVVALIVFTAVIGMFLAVPGLPPLRESIAGFIGILILLRPGSAVLHPAAVLLVGAALANALYQLLTRKLLDENPHTTLFYSASVGTLLLSLALPFVVDASNFSRTSIALFVLMGLLAGLGHWCLTHAYLQAPASLLTPFTYLQILWATAFGYAIFGQHPDAVSAAGMAIIVASGLSLALWERRRMRLL